MLLRLSVPVNIRVPPELLLESCDARLTLFSSLTQRVASRPKGVAARALFRLPPVERLVFCRGFEYGGSKDV